VKLEFAWYRCLFDLPGRRKRSGPEQATSSSIRRVRGVRDEGRLRPSRLRSRRLAQDLRPPHRLAADTADKGITDALDTTDAEFGPGAEGDEDSSQEFFATQVGGRSRAGRSG